MKISIRSMIIVIGLFYGVNLWTMNDQGLTPAVDLSESKKEQEKEELNLVPVELPQTWGSVEKINKEEDETFTASTFGELMEDQFKRGEEFIIARVVTRDEKDKRYVHYFDAYSLNAHMYGKYPIEKWEIKEKILNPLNRLKIEDVDYFGIKEGEKSFSFICNSRELLEDRRETLENKFYLNCNNTSLQFNLGNKYYGAGKYKIAEEYYLRVGKPELKKNEVLAQWVQANARLGDIYYHGKGIAEPDYKKARECYERVSTPDCNIKMMLSPWTAINNNLGNIYYNGLGLNEPDYKKAKDLYERIATPQVNYSNMALWMNANLKMGKIYYELDEPDYKKAREYYERIIKSEYEKENTNAWIVANLNLGDIYYSSSDKQEKAMEHYKIISDPKFEQTNLREWGYANIRIGDIYYNGIGMKYDHEKAKEYYEKVCIPKIKDVDKALWVNANLRLGDVYCYGIGINNIYQKAKEYYVRVLDVDSKKAIEHLEKMATSEEVKNKNLDTWAQANFKLSNVYLEMKDIEKAKTCLEKIGISEEVKNKNLGIWVQANFKLSYFYLKMKDIEKAKTCLEKMATSEEVKNKNLDTWAQANFKLSNVYLEMKDIEKAKTCLEKMATSEEVKNKNLDTWTQANFKLSNVYLEMKDIEKAKTCLEKIGISEEVKNKNLGIWTEANFKLSDIYLQMKDIEKAKTFLEKLAIDEIKDKHFCLYQAAVNRLSKLDKKPVSEEFKEARKKFHASIIKGDTELVQALLTKYPDLITAKIRFIPLEHVVRYKKVEMLKVFLNTVSNLIASSFFKKIKSSARKRVNIALKIAKEVEKDQTIQPMTDLLLDWIEKDKSIKEELDIEAESKEEEENNLD